MKKIFFTAAILTLGGSSLMAQRDHHPMMSKERMEDRSDKLKTDLKLDATQSAQLDAIDAKYNAQIESHAKAIKDLHDQKKADIEAILTPEQKEVLKAKRDDKKAEIKNRIQKYRKNNP